MSWSVASGGTSSTTDCSDPSGIRTVTLRRSAAAGRVRALASAAAITAERRRVLSVRDMRGGRYGAA